MPEKSSFSANMPSLVTLILRCFQNGSREARLIRARQWCAATSDHSGPVSTEWLVWTTARTFYIIVSFTELHLHPSTRQSTLSNGHYSRNFLSTWIMSSTTQPLPGRTGPPQQSMVVQGASQCSCWLFNPCLYCLHSCSTKTGYLHIPPVPSFSISSLELYRVDIHPHHWTHEFPLHQWVEWINILTYHPPFIPHFSACESSVSL